MALLHLLIRIVEKPECSLIVAHFNHRLRGRFSDADERFVLRAASKCNLPAVTAGGEVRQAAKDRGISIEMAAREMRHAFLARVARDQACNIIATAHHADDQLELFFIRVARGAGGEGLGGMAPRRSLSEAPAVALVRPLLTITRKEIEAWIASQKIRFREDESNLSTEVLRNRIRHRLVPQLLRDLGPESPRLILRSMELVDADADCTAEQARLWLDRARPDPEFSQLHRAVQRQAVRLQLLDLHIAPEFKWVEQLRLSPEEPLTIHAHLRLQRDACGRIHRVQVDAPTEYNPDRLPVQLKGKSGELKFAGRTIRWSIRRQLDPVWVRREKSGVEVFDVTCLGRVLELRHWTPGDRFRPLGATHATKLQDLFVNKKIPRRERRQRVVMVGADQTLAWVEGFAPSESFKVRPATRGFLIWQWSTSQLVERGRIRRSGGDVPIRPTLQKTTNAPRENRRGGV